MNVDTNCQRIVDAFFQQFSNFNLQNYFKEKLKKTEENLVAQLSKARELRKNKILNETKDTETLMAEEENDDEAIRNFVRRKNVQRKLIITTKFWLVLCFTQDLLGLSVQQEEPVDSLVLRRTQIHNLQRQERVVPHQSAR